MEDLIVLASVVALCGSANIVLKHPLYHILPEGNAKCSVCPYCGTAECISNAARITDSLDVSINPCEDFYSFACGGWLNARMVPQDKSHVSVFTNLDKNMAAVIKLLNRKYDVNDLESVKKAKDLYYSCINNSNEQSHAIWAIRLIRKTFQEWPMTVTTWDEDTFDLEDFLTRALYLGSQPLIKISVEANFTLGQDGQLIAPNFLQMNSPEFGLPNKMYYTSQKSEITFSAYRKKILFDARRFGIQDEEIANSDISDIIDVETTLNQILTDTQSQNKTEYTLSKLQSEHGQLLNWTHFLTSIMSTPAVGITDLADNEKIFINNPAYLSQMAGYFSKLSKRTQANYIIWRVFDSLESVVLHGSRKKQASMLQAVYGIKFEPSVEAACVDYVSHSFEIVVHRLLYTERLPRAELTLIQTIFKDVQDEFDRIIEEQDWLDNKSMIVVKEKKAALLTRMVFYQVAMNDTYVEDYYQNITISKDSFFRNVLVEKKETILSNLRMLRKPHRYAISDLPYMSIAMMNCYENIIEMSSSTFEAPMFSPHMPQALNYGGIGFIYAHEIVHAFDNIGYKRNKHGAEGKWWTDDTIARFERRYQCLVDQYNKLYHEQTGKYITGTLAVAENIADNAAIKVAYRAYKQLTKFHGIEERSLPGLNYTHDQLFFINNAQILCTRMSQETALYLSSQQIPTHMRVTGVFRNYANFSSTFKCPTGSPMNPEEKCQVW